MPDWLWQAMLFSGGFAIGFIADATRHAIRNRRRQEAERMAPPPF